MRKIIKSSDTEEINTFRLHYFPNIPASTTRDGAGPSNAGAAGQGGVQQRSSREPAPPSPEEIDAERRREAERQGYGAGFARGEQAGLQAAQEKAAPLLKTLAATLVELDGVRQRIRRQLEQEVVELALQVARKVIRHELTLSSDAILHVVKDAMGVMDDPGKIAIRLHPEDLRRIRGADRELGDVLDNIDSVQFEEDPGIEAGGCYIQTEFGDIDARVQEQIRKIEEAFRAGMAPAADRGEGG